MLPGALFQETAGRWGSKLHSWFSYCTIRRSFASTGRRVFIRFCCLRKNTGYSVFLQASTFCFPSLATLVVHEVVRKHTCITGKLNVWPDVSSYSVNPFLHQQLNFRQCVKKDERLLLLTLIRCTLRYTTMISTWHEHRSGASEPIVRFDVADTQYAIRKRHFLKWLAPSTNHLTLLGIPSINQCGTKVF